MSEPTRHLAATSHATVDAISHRQYMRPTEFRRGSSAATQRRIASPEPRVDLDMADHLVDLVLRFQPFLEPAGNARHAVWEQIQIAMRETSNPRIATTHGMKLHFNMLCHVASTPNDADHASLPRDLRAKLLRCIEMTKQGSRPSTVLTLDSDDGTREQQEDENGVNVAEASTRGPQTRSTRGTTPPQEDVVWAMYERMAERFNRETMAFLENQRLVYGAVFHALNQAPGGH